MDQTVETEVGYHMRDPAPNAVQDKRTELEKIQSILCISNSRQWHPSCIEWSLWKKFAFRPAAQLRDPTPETEHHRRHPVYRLNKENEKQLLQQVAAFDKLYV